MQLENAHSALHSKEQAQLQRQQSHHEDSGTAPDVAQLKAEVNQLRGELQRKEQESLRLRPPEEQKPRGMSPDGIGMHGKVDTTRLQSILKSFHEVSLLFPYSLPMTLQIPLPAPHVPSSKCLLSMLRPCPVLPPSPPLLHPLAYAS